MLKSRRESAGGLTWRRVDGPVTEKQSELPQEYPHGMHKSYQTPKPTSELCLIACITDDPFTHAYVRTGAMFWHHAYPIRGRESGSRISDYTQTFCSRLTEHADVRACTNRASVTCVLHAPCSNTQPLKTACISLNTGVS